MLIDGVTSELPQRYEPEESFIERFLNNLSRPYKTMQVDLSPATGIKIKVKEIKRGKKKISR